MPGYSVRTVRSLGLAQAYDAGALKAKANELRAIILTRDKDFLDPADFQICTHPGVLRLDLPSALSTCVPRIEAFLQSPHYKLCKHAVVRLGVSTALVQTRHRGPVEEIAYFSEPQD